MKILYLLRHAKAESGGVGMNDEDRALSERGRRASASIGNYMKKKDYIPQLALCSSSVRTRQTLEEVARAAGTVWPARFEKSLYLATAEEMLRVIAQADDACASLLVVGHNPGMHHLALLLADPEPEDLHHALELKYPTGTLTALKISGAHWSDIAPGAGQLTDFVTPEGL